MVATWIEDRDRWPGDGDFSVRFLHDAFDGAAPFTDDATDQIVMGQDLQRHLTETIKDTERSLLISLITIQLWL